MIRHACWTAAALSVLALLAGCSGPDTTAVPTEGAAPFVCDGVSARGVELALGGAAVAERTEGSWAEGERFSCAVTREQGSGTIMVTSMPVDQSGTWGSDENSIQSTLASQGGAERITSGGDGIGYVFAQGSAGWVCSGRLTLVVLDDMSTAKRDQRADARALLVSMLPWACGGEKVPARTVGK